MAAQAQQQAQKEHLLDTVVLDQEAIEVREEDGWWVVPDSVAMREGVFKRIFRPREELESSYLSLEGTPITLSEHPPQTPNRDSGLVVARDETRGYARNVRWDADRAAIVYDMHLAARTTNPGFEVPASVVEANKRLVESLQAGAPVETSPGSFVRFERSPGERDGELFDAVARDISFFHIAVTQAGACGWADGCGAGRGQLMDDKQADTLIGRVTRAVRDTLSKRGDEMKTKTKEKENAEAQRDSDPEAGKAEGKGSPGAQRDNKQDDPDPKDGQEQEQPNGQGQGAQHDAKDCTCSKSKGGQGGQRDNAGDTSGVVLDSKTQAALKASLDSSLKPLADRLDQIEQGHKEAESQRVTEKRQALADFRGTKPDDFKDYPEPVLDSEIQLEVQRNAGTDGFAPRRAVRDSEDDGKPYVKTEHGFTAKTLDAKAWEGVN